MEYSHWSWLHSWGIGQRLCLITANRTLGFGLFFLYLGSVKGNKYNHNYVYRLYRELGLYLGDKPKRCLNRDKMDKLAEQRRINTLWSMDFMQDCIANGSTFRADRFSTLMPLPNAQKFDQLSKSEI